MTITYNTLRCMALSGAFLLGSAGAAAAQYAGPPKGAATTLENLWSGYNGAIELGGASQSDDSFVFGRYTGLTDQGPFGIGNLVVRGRDKWDSGNTRYWEVLGANLGLTSRELSARYGQQGRWNASFFSSQLPFYQSDTARTIFGGSGGASLTLPSNLPRNTNSALGQQLLPYLSPLNVNLDRKTLGGGFSVQPQRDWQFGSTFSHEHKDGIKEQSMTVNVRSDPTFFPEPVDYDSDTFEASAAYNNAAVQLQVGYNFSNFANNDSAVLLPSPFMGALQQPVGAISQWALPASSSAHDLNFTSAYKLTKTIRINVNLGYGRQLQNEPLLPYTRNANFVTDALPRSSLDGKVQTYFAQFKATMHPVAKLDLNASYTYDERANKTPRDPYMSMEEPEWETLLMWNLPFGFTNQVAKLDASYRLWKGNRFAAGYEHRKLDRTFAEVTEQRENTVRFRLAQDFRLGNGYVSYLYGNRNGSPYEPGAYDFALGNLPSTTPLLPYPNNREFSGYLLEPNYYQFRRFFEADRRRHEAKAGSTFDVAQALSLDVSGRRTSDDYANSPFGVTGSQSWSANADLAYSTGKVVELHGFYTYESVGNDQRSLASSGIVNNTPTAQWTWTSNYQDRVHTFGVGATWEVVEDLLKVGPRFEVVAATTDIDVVSGRGAGTSAQYVSKPVPSIESSSRGVKLFGEYTLRPNSILRVVYDFERLTAKDPALDTGPIPNAVTTSLAGVTGAPNYGWLLAGDTSGAYTLHLFSASIVWRF